MINLSGQLFDTCGPRYQRLLCDITTTLIVAKGQLISEQIYAVLNFPKIQRNIDRISALASKMGQIKKAKACYHPNYWLFIIWYKELPLSFWFDPF